MSNESQRKGNFEHKIFKGVVLVLVFAFFMLIFYFIYVQLADTFSNPDKIGRGGNKYSQYFIEKVLNVIFY
jgi:hypothetical protein